MNDLYKKYVTDRLTRQDLEILKNSDSSIIDRDLESFMKDEWLSGGLDPSKVSDEVMTRVKARLDEKIQSKHLTFLFI